MPDSKIAEIKMTYRVEDKDVTRFEFNQDSCYASSVECIKIDGITPEVKESWNEYSVETNTLFLYNDKFVNIDYFHPSDLKSLTLYPKKEAILKYGHKGLSPIFIMQLKEGKTIRDKPVGGILLRTK